MFLSQRIESLFRDKERFEKAYRKGFFEKRTLEYAMAHPDLAIGYYQIMAWFERKLADAIKDEELSRVIIEN